MAMTGALEFDLYLLPQQSCLRAEEWQLQTTSQLPVMAGRRARFSINHGSVPTSSSGQPYDQRPPILLSRASDARDQRLPNHPEPWITARFLRD